MRCLKIKENNLNVIEQLCNNEEDCNNFINFIIKNKDKLNKATK